MNLATVASTLIILDLLKFDLGTCSAISSFDYDWQLQIVVLVRFQSSQFIWKMQQ